MCILRFLCCSLSGLFLSTLVAGPVPTGKPATYPNWWFERDVIPRKAGSTGNLTPGWPIDYLTADDYGVANLGQLKYIAIQAAAEFNGFLAGGAGPDINGLVQGWSLWPAQTNRDDYSALNQGQLKYVAAFYYARLTQLGYNGQPLSAGQTKPWSLGTGDDDAYALVNLGQLKYVFMFNPVPILDTDSDGLPDSWEIAYFSSLGAQTGSGNADSSVVDRLSNRIEYLLGTDPSVAHSDGTSAASLGLVIYSPN